VVARVALALLVAVPAVASAAEPEPDARLHFERGSALYDAGDYRGALREFEQANRILPRREFLINLGQAHRMLNEFAEARALYARYLESAPEGDPYGPEVRDILAELDRRLAAPAPPQHKADGQVERRRRRLWWLLGGVGAAAAVLAVALGLGIYFGTRSDGGCDPGLVSCIDLRR
jgi:tetratricopeptide (TPR) repeat protein